MRLIDKDRLISILNAKADMALGEPKKYFAHVAQMVELLPEVDVVEVVRCKDCAESAVLGDSAENRRYCAHLGFRVEDEGFCCDGRRAGDPDPTDDC